MDIALMILNALPELAKQVLALFIVVDPIGNIPTFIALTQGLSPSARQQAFRTATIIGLTLVITFALAGDQILSFFGITLNDFMIAGGILLFAIAIKILVLEGWKGLAEQREGVSAVPMAIPLLAGPGAITTTIVSLRSNGLYITLASTLIVFAVAGIIFHYIEPLNRLLGRTGSLVIERVMAMLLAAIAVGYVLKGLEHRLLPTLAST